MTTVLVIDDNEVDRKQIRRLLAGRHELVEATTAGEGVAAAASHEVDCVLLDYRLPDEDGVRVIDLMRGRALPIVMLTSQGSEQVAVEALKHGAVDYLLKGELTRERLQQAISVAIEQGRLRAELDRHRRELELAVTQLSAQRAELAATNAALQQREAHLRFVLGQLPVVHWTTDLSLTITHLGGAGLETFGGAGQSAVGRSVASLEFSGADTQECVTAHELALAGSYGLHRAVVRGRWYQVHVGALRDAAGAVVGTIGLALDVSEARGLEQQLRHAVKMEALGQLAGGVAHDFNNLLSAILGFATFARDGLAPGEALREDVDQIIAAADRATALVRQLMTFSRRSSSAARVVEVAPVVLGTLPMLRRLVGEDVALTHAAAPEPWRVRVDPNELEQVVVNLVVNARDAMARGGRIEVEVLHVALTEELVSTREHRIAPGEYVVLCVTDEGEGIPRDVLDRVFDPFFTTKDVGKGTGLGLSTVYGIARQCGGAVTVYSEPGHGTSFRVYLPRALEGEAAAPAAASPTPRGTETVLVVEDEEPVRLVAVRALRALGYAVLDAAGGESAIARSAAHGGPIDLLLTDVVMPGASGPEVARALSAARPALRVLYMSGYTERAARSRGRLPPGAKLVEKPLTLDALGRAVRDALDAAPQGNSTTRQ